MKYFLIQTGLRGGYMPDSSYPIRCETRRDLRDVVKSEAAQANYGGDMVGLSDRAQASFTAWIWSDAVKKKAQYLPYALPYGIRRQGKPYAIFVVPISRAEFLEHEGAEQ